MQPFQERVVDEKADLDVRRTKLEAFIGTTAFYALPADERNRLTRQYKLQGDLSAVLGERIAAFI